MKRWNDNNDPVKWKQRLDYLRRSALGQLGPEWDLKRAREDHPFWFYKPQWYWFGWKTLIPFQIGHDEYARCTLMLGWTLTGRIVIALGDCGDTECKAEAIRDLKEGLIG